MKLEYNIKIAIKMEEQVNKIIKTCKISEKKVYWILLELEKAKSSGIKKQELKSKIKDSELEKKFDRVLDELEKRFVVDYAGELAFLDNKGYHLLAYKGKNIEFHNPPNICLLNAKCMRRELLTPEEMTGENDYLEGGNN